MGQLGTPGKAAAQPNERRKGIPASLEKGTGEGCQAPDRFGMRACIYIMHAGWPMLDELLAVLWTHPYVYVEVVVISWALPRAEFHRYL
jgi:hypothetical protein